MNQLTTHATAASRTVAVFVHATPIRKDEDGRYCLNDLHKAAGEQERHKPGDFIRQVSTQELIAEVSKSGNPRIKPVEMSKGRYGGTYVHKYIALDYAAWISPAFKIEVFKAFEESRQETPVGGQMVVPAETDYVEIFRMALKVAESNKLLEAQIEAERPRVAFANAVEADESTRTIRETAKQFGLSDQRLTALLIEKKLLYRAAHPRGGQSQVLPYQQFIDDESFVVRSYAVSADHVRSRTQITGKGVLRIHRLLSQQRLN